MCIRNIKKKLCVQVKASRIQKHRIPSHLHKNAKKQKHPQWKKPAVDLYAND